MSDKKFEESDRDFEAIYDAVTSTSQGRWFLREYGRRNRHSDTLSILDAIEKLSAQASETKATIDTTLSSHVVEELGELMDVVTQFRHAQATIETDTFKERIADFIDQFEFHLLRTRDFLGVADAMPPQGNAGETKSGILDSLPPELADEAALVEGFEDSTLALKSGTS